MSTHMEQLSKEETEALKAILAQQSHRARRPLSLNTLLQLWSDFVGKVERGYEGSIYEYTNELSSRDLLEEIRESGPASLGQKLSAALDPWDKRFFEATSATKSPLLPAKRESGKWWFRSPKNPGQELANDLRSEGL